MTDAAIELTVSGVTKRFGGLLAVSQILLQIRAGRIHGLIGPNGAGKSTMIGLIPGGAMMTPAQFTSCDVGLAYGVFGFVAAVLSGFGSLLGALVGGVPLGVVNAVFGRHVSSNCQTVIAFAIPLVLLAVRPQGIIGRHWEEA